jgi:hypothetical protein
MGVWVTVGVALGRGARVGEAVNVGVAEAGSVIVCSAKTVWAGADVGEEDNVRTGVGVSVRASRFARTEVGVAVEREGGEEVADGGKD